MVSDSNNKRGKSPLFEYFSHLCFTIATVHLAKHVMWPSSDSVWEGNSQDLDTETRDIHWDHYCNNVMLHLLRMRDMATSSKVPFTCIFPSSLKALMKIRIPGMTFGNSQIGCEH